MSADESGWFRLVESDQLTRGSVVACDLGGVDLVLWRSEAGEPCAMEARCPHQWSHLATQGAVDGEEIVCLTHMWRFDRDGHGSQSDAGAKHHLQTTIAVHPSAERDGGVWVRLG